jgi:hypothetical protein
MGKSLFVAFTREDEHLLFLDTTETVLYGTFNGLSLLMID